jgi:hypothetical protein
MRNSGPTDLDEHWRAFLAANRDARSVVDGAIARTGLTEEEVLVWLIEAWAAMQVQPNEVDDRPAAQSMMQ